MTNASRHVLGIGLALVALFEIQPAAFGQTSVVVEVRVLQLSRKDLDPLRASPAAPHIAIVLPQSVANLLADVSRSKTVHRVELQAAGGSATQFALDSRISAYPAGSLETQTVYNVGIRIDLTPKVFQNRDITLSTASRINIRRGPDADGGQTVIFENPLTRDDIRVHDGETILLSGFLSDSERSSLPTLPSSPDNPMLTYLLAKSAAPQDKSEIAILLTPRIAGVLLNAAKETRPMYTVQVGAFESAEKAEVLVAQLSKKYGAVFIDKVESGKTPFHVRVGRFPDQKTAKQLQDRLSHDGLKSFVTTLE